MFRSNNDSTTANLFRSHFKAHFKARKTAAECRLFDPERTNAYIERFLTAAEVRSYESHMSACDFCRASTVALARLAEPEPALNQLAGDRPGVAAALLTALTALTGPLRSGLVPRIALAATGLLVLAVGIPVLMSLQNSDENRSQPEAVRLSEATPETKPGIPAPQSATPEQVAATASRRAVEIAPSSAPAEEAEEADRGETERQAASESKDEAGPRPEPQPASVSAERAAAPERPAAPPAEGSARRSDQDRRQLPTIDSAEALRLPKQDDKSAVVSVLRPGAVGTTLGPGRESTATIRPEDAIAPPTEPAADPTRTRPTIAQPTPGGSREAAAAESGRRRAPLEKRVGKKRFWLQNDVWTDQSYNPAKELPVVTIVRGSDVFNEEMARRKSGLKVYLTGFGEKESAIIVLQNTVYRLVPAASKTE